MLDIPTVEATSYYVQLTDLCFFETDIHILRVSSSKFPKFGQHINSITHFIKRKINKIFKGDMISFCLKGFELCKNQKPKAFLIKQSLLSYLIEGFNK